MNGESPIPANHVEFCKAIARVCREYEVQHFRGTFRPGWRDPWREEISLTFQEGRHGVQTGEVYIEATQRVNVKIDGAGLEEIPQ